MPGAFLHDERVRDAVALTALTPTAAGMPVANLRDPQPRLRARFTGGAASVLVDFGTATAVEAVALISNNLSANATVRWRLGTLEIPNAGHDSGILPAHTGDEANGNVVLLRSGACAVVPSRDHAFFQQAQLERLFGDDLLQRTGFEAKFFDLVGGGGAGGIAGQAAL